MSQYKMTSFYNVTKTNYETPEYHAYTAEFKYTWCDHYIQRYRVSDTIIPDGANYFIDVYEDGCVYEVIVNDIENFNRREYTLHTLIGTKGIEHHAMKSMFKCNK